MYNLVKFSRITKRRCLQTMFFTDIQQRNKLNGSSSTDRVSAVHEYTVFFKRAGNTTNIHTTSCVNMTGSNETNEKQRGALIVLEGCDRAGKTTQAQKLIKSLTDDGIKIKFMRFPERSTKIGRIINQYLSCADNLEDHAIHLLFSANRWELVAELLETLKEGTSVIIDRYAFSGVVFSAAKQGMALEWCKQSDVGLPKPDKVLFLNLSPEEARKRGDFGQERYEKEEIQKKVHEYYMELKDDSWKIIDASKNMDVVQEEIKKECLQTIKMTKQTLGKLWVVEESSE
ncbi:thymidylate kinase [Oratosquilla oratoria]|uniref:thymidylate kinase n=1 Tax=Oratosquilla oratoria TaxID=337810 RepID=UPI003F761F96